MPEISDEELRRLFQKAEVADFIEPIINNPNLSDRAKALIKEQYPHLSIADYDLKQQFNKRFDDLEKQRKDEEENRRKAAEQKSWDDELNEVKQEYGFTDDGVEQLKKFMVEKKIGSYKTGAEHYAMKNPKQSDATHHDGHWHFQKQDNFAEIAKDPEDWAYNEIFGALTRDQERERGGR